MGEGFGLGDKNFVTGMGMALLGGADSHGVAAIEYSTDYDESKNNSHFSVGGLYGSLACSNDYLGQCYGCGHWRREVR
ncbi:hypothetical protein [Rubritalea tangerina]|uniref:hypothetical protein n=1 Tax=Rubritalea tangerina TaxID=430798 RepID=UPI003609E308